MADHTDRRVVITGLGVVASNGIGKSESRFQVQRLRKTISLHLLLVAVRLPAEHASMLIEKVEQGKRLVWGQPGGMGVEQLTP